MRRGAMTAGVALGLAACAGGPEAPVVGPPPTLQEIAAEARADAADGADMAEADIADIVAWAWTERAQAAGLVDPQVQAEAADPARGDDGPIASCADHFAAADARDGWRTVLRAGKQLMPAPPREAVADLLCAQAEAWSRGEIEAFMSGYHQSPSLRFASGGSVTTGWAATLARYQARYPDADAMGRLSFEDLDIDILSDSAALAFGRWRLNYEDADGPAPEGLFTLVLRRIEGRWAIVHDHTSSASP